MLCHSLGKAYGRLPHEILRLTPFEKAFNQWCLQVGSKAEAEAVKAKPE